MAERCQNCGVAIEDIRQPYSTFCVNCSIKAMKTPTDVVVGTEPTIVTRRCGMCDNRYYRYNGHNFCLFCLGQFATREEMEVVRLLINPWDRFQRILPMLSYAHAMRGINKDRVLLYFAHVASYNTKVTRRVLEENVTYQGALDWRLLLRFQLAQKDLANLRNWQRIQMLDLDQYRSIIQVDRLLTVKNWKIFKCIYPDPLYNPHELDESVTHQADVDAIVQTIVMEQRWNDVAIVADAMEESGCSNDVILNHCRTPYDHTPYCWALWELWRNGPNPPPVRQYVKPRWANPTLESLFMHIEPSTQEMMERARHREQRALTDVQRVLEGLPPIQQRNMEINNPEDVDLWGRDLAERVGEPTTEEEE